MAATYIPNHKNVNLYKDFVNITEEISSDFSSDKIIICGDFDLPNISWVNDSANYVILSGINNKIREAADVLQGTATLLDLIQCCPPHRLKGYTLDLLFASSTLCENLPLEDDLLQADPAHHQSAYFMIKNVSSSASYSESENFPNKNFYRANYGVINNLLNVDWVGLLESGTIIQSVETFYDIVNNIIDQNVPNFPSSPSHYPPWFSHELIDLTSEKKRLHAISQESRRLHYPTQAQDYREFQMVRSQCLRLSRQLYLGYIENTENNIKHHKKNFWKFVHRFTQGNTLPTSMYLRDRSAQCKRSICDLLADHFSSVYTAHHLIDLESLESRELLISHQVSEAEVSLELSRLDDNIKSGPDCIPPTL